MSDDGGGDCGGGDTAGDNFESGGGNEVGVCMDMDPADCTDITFTENTEYVGRYYGGGGIDRCHHVHRNYSNHDAYITDPKARCVLITAFITICLIICKLNFNYLKLFSLLPFFTYFSGYWAFQRYRELS